jgi:DNA-binding NtrC family response regulator
LIGYVLDRAQQQHGLSAKLSVSEDAERLLLAYPWPGNVRQMENVINRACILAEDDCITVDDLTPEITRAHGRNLAHGTPIASQRCLRDQLRDYEANLIFRMLDETSGDRRLAAQRLGIGLSSLYRKLEEFEAFGIARNPGSAAQSIQESNFEQGTKHETSRN